MHPIDGIAPTSGEEYDPVFLHSRKEAILIFALWVVMLLWSVPYCYFAGYGQYDPATFETVLGVPKWLFWGIAVPWLVADIFTTWFCFCYMQEDDLGEANEGADLAEEVAEMHAAQNGAAASHPSTDAAERKGDRA